MIEHGLGSREVAPPKTTCNCHRKNCHGEQIDGPECIRYSAGSDNESFTQSDDDEQPMAFAKMLGMYVPLLRLSANCRCNDIESNCKSPEPVLRCTSYISPQ